MSVAGPGADPPSASRWLRQYVHDHYVLSRGEFELFQRSARTQSGDRVRAQVTALTAEVAEDRAALLAMVDELAVGRSPFQEALVASAERLGRLKPNGTLLRRSPLTDLVELEAMTVAVHARQVMWRCLREAAEGEPLLNPYYLDRLVQRAKDQEARLDTLRVEVARTVFAAGASPGTPSVIVAVTGATGNIGSAVVEHLLAGGHEVRGLARRRPQGTALDDRVQWTEVNLASQDRASRLAVALAGVEVVVHTAWGFQPMRDPDYLQRLAIGGTLAVVRAAEAAGVRQLVHLSSAGAYSPGHDVHAVDEDWPTGGIQQLGYSRQKAAVERVLDAHEARPDHTLLVARVRPCLVAREAAASAVGRYVLPSLVPSWAVSAVPVLPLDRGFRLQAVHSHDVATAVVAIIERQASGAFNLAADQVLDSRDVAAALGARPVHVPWGVLRAAIAGAWNAHLQPVEPGWLDLAWHVPMVSTRRAKAVLDWTPEHEAAAVLAEAVQGLVDRSGSDTPALRPRRWIEQAAHLARNGPVSRRPMA